MNKDTKVKVKVITSGIICKIQLIIGLYFAIASGVVFVNTLMDSEYRNTSGAIGGYIVILILVAFGIWLILLSRKTSKLIKTFRNYIVILSADSTGSIIHLAANSGTSIEVVKKNLNEMIKRKYFINAILDMDENHIVFPMSIHSQTQSQGMVNNTTQDQNGECEYIVVTCKGCGNYYEIKKGTVGECKYCGTYIT